MFFQSVSLCTIHSSLFLKTSHNDPLLFIYFSDSVFAMRDAYNGSISSDNSALKGYLAFNSSIVPSLPNLDVTLGSETFSIPPSRYIVPRQLYPILNVTDVPGLERTWIASAGPGTFILGQKWLENVYTAYDSKLPFFLSFSSDFPFCNIMNFSLFLLFD